MPRQYEVYSIFQTNLGLESFLKKNLGLDSYETLTNKYISKPLSDFGDFFFTHMDVHSNLRNLWRKRFLGIV